MHAFKLIQEFKIKIIYVLVPIFPKDLLNKLKKKNLAGFVEKKNK